jgi:hypothetical protein
MPPGEPLALFPNSMGEASVRFTPPAQSGPRAGTVRVGIRVAAVSTPHDAKVEEFDLSIATVASGHTARRVQRQRRIGRLVGLQHDRYRLPELHLTRGRLGRRRAHA